MLMILLVACQTEQEQDTEVIIEENIFLTEYNLSNIDTYTREQVYSLNGELQRRALRLMSPSTKKRLWLDKMDHIKQFVSSPKEKEFIEDIEKLIESLTFNEVWTSDDLKSFNSTIKNAQKRFNWTQDFVVYSFGTLHNLDKEITVENDFFGRYNTGKGGIVSFSGLKEANTRSSGCDCSWGWCPGELECYTVSCQETSDGCGFLGFGSCDAHCEQAVNTDIGIE